MLKTTDQLFTEFAETIGAEEMTRLCRAYIQTSDVNRIVSSGIAHRQSEQSNVSDEEDTRIAAYCFKEDICYHCFKENPEERHSLYSKYKLCAYCDDLELDRNAVLNEVKPDTLQENACGVCGFSYAEPFMPCTSFNCAYSEREEYRQKFNERIVPPLGSYEDVRCSGTTLDQVMDEAAKRLQ